MRKRAGLRTWTRALGASGLTPQAEAWVQQIEDEIRSAVLGDPGYLEDSGDLAGGGGEIRGGDGLADVSPAVEWRRDRGT
jgi:hypothetical protein